MSGFLLDHEFRGPGDTIEAAAYRIQSRYGVPVHTTLRLRQSREIKDMFVSSFVPVLNAYLAVKDKMESAATRMERAYEEERNRAVDPRLRRMAAAIAGKETQKEEEG